MDIDDTRIEGYRKPGEGSSWVYLPRKDGSAICILYEDTKRIATLLQPHHEMLLEDQRKGLLEKGWYPMTRDDIWNTISSDS